MNRKLVFNSLLTIIASLLSTYTLGDNHQNLEERVAALESAVLQGDELWHEHLSFSGLLEVDVNYTDPDAGNSTSDLVIATAALGIDALLADNLSAALVLLYEEDATDFEVDIATVSYTYHDNGLSFTLGQDYMPFGSYSSVLINDTLALEIGETRETALVAHYERDQLAGAVYVFNGDQDQDGRNQLTNFGARILFTGDNVTLGADYISNLADSDTLQGKNYGYSAGADVVAGASIHGAFTVDAVQLVVEHLRAMDKLLVDGAGSEPRATHLEVSFTARGFTYGVAYQRTDDALFLGLPEERINAGLRTEIAAGLGLGLELAVDDDYSKADGGSGDSTNQLVLQLTAEF